MIETPAKVIAVEPGYAWVEAERRSGCSHCTSGESCGVSSLSKLFGIRRQRLRLPDPLGLHAGEEVVLALCESRLVGAAAAAYMLPLLAMIGMALLSASLGYGQSTLGLSSLAGLAGGLWLVSRRSGGRYAIAHYQPVIQARKRPGEYTIEFKSEHAGVNHERISRSDR